MTCHDHRNLLDAYFDGELDLPHTLELEQHLNECSICQALHTRNQVLRRALQSPEAYLSPPQALTEQILLSIRPQPPSALQTRGRFARAASLLGLAALVLLSVVGFALFHSVQQRSADDLIASEVVASHIRSLMPGHLTDVASSDHHTVKPWFAGKLDFSPTVKDLRAQGFPLAGGRLDYLGGRAVAALLYSHGPHTINLFVWPAAKAESGVRPIIRNGYNLIEWNQGGMTYWAVSDLNSQELAQFARALRK